MSKRVRLNEDNNPLTSTESVFTTLEQVSKSASQQVSNIEVVETRSNNADISNKPTSQHNSKSNLDIPNKSSIRKSTFQLSQEVLRQLDRYHLELQLELGKDVAPYKEVIVEEAIAQFLLKPNQELLLKRQKTR